MNLSRQTVSSDLNFWVNTQHQWKFSCYSPFTSSTTMSEFEGYSMEELRFMTYNARKTNKTKFMKWFFFYFYKIELINFIEF